MQHILQGQSPGQLTDLGREQAAEVREILCHTHIDAFISSDQQRAIDTCEIIAGAHEGVPITTTPLLRERDWGSITGLPFSMLPNVQWPADVESMKHMKQRAAQFVDMVKREYPGLTVVAVAHGIINKVIEALLTQRRIYDVVKMKNAEVREFLL